MDFKYLFMYSEKKQRFFWIPFWKYKIGFLFF